MSHQCNVEGQYNEGIKYKGRTDINGGAVRLRNKYNMKLVFDTE